MEVDEVQRFVTRTIELGMRSSRTSVPPLEYLNEEQELRVLPNKVVFLYARNIE